MIFEQLAWLLVILHVSTKTFAEPPVNSNGGGNSIVSQRLLNRVADIIANGGDGSSRSGTENNEGPSIVDQQLLDRIARIISQNEKQVSWSNKAQTRSNELTPSRSLSLPPSGSEQEAGTAGTEDIETTHDLAGPHFELSPPEPVPRIASFDIGNDDEDNRYSASTQFVSQDSYADNRNLYQRNGRIELEQPQNAERIASFDIEGEKPPAPFTPPQARRGFFSNTK